MPTPNMHFGFNIRQQELFQPTEEEINADLDRNRNDDVCEVL